MQLNLCMTCSIMMWSYFRIRKDVRNVLGKWYTKKRSFLKSLSELATFSKHKTYQFLLATCLPKDDGDDVTCVISRHVHWLIFFFRFQEKPAAPPPSAPNSTSTTSSANTPSVVSQNGLTKNSDHSMDTTSSRNGGESPDDYEKEERRRAAQRVLGKQG